MAHFYKSTHTIDCMRPHLGLAQTKTRFIKRRIVLYRIFGQELEENVF